MQVAQRPTPKLRATAAGGKGCPCSSSDGERKALRGGETPTPAEGVHRNAASLSPWTSSGGLDLRAKEEMSSPPPLTRIPSRADPGASRSSSSAGRGKLRGSPARFCVSPGRANATPYRWQAEPPSASPSPSPPPNPLEEKGKGGGRERRRGAGPGAGSRGAQSPPSPRPFSAPRPLSTNGARRWAGPVTAAVWVRVAPLLFFSPFSLSLSFFFLPFLFL